MQIYRNETMGETVFVLCTEKQSESREMGVSITINKPPLLSLQPAVISVLSSANGGGAVASQRSPSVL